MVAMLEANEAGASRLPVMAPELIRHLQGHFYRGAAIVGVEHPAARTVRKAREQQLRQLNGRGMRDPGEVNVVKLLHGLVQRLHQRRITMTVQDGPP